MQVELINVDPAQRLEVFDAVSQLGFRYHYDGNDLTAVRSPEACIADSEEPALRRSLADRDAAIWAKAAEPNPAEVQDMWRPHYPRDNISEPGHRDFGVPLELTSITGSKMTAPFDRTVVRLPAVVFPASIGHENDRVQPDVPKFLGACAASFSCGFSEPVAALGFLPDHALCIESDGSLRLLEESVWHSNLFFSRWFRNDRSTSWHWRVARDWPTPKPVRGLVAHCYHRFHQQYFHWLFDLMPRVWLLRQHSPYADVKQWFVGPLDRGFKQPMLELYDISPDMCRNDQEGVVAYEAAICTGFRFEEPIGTRPAYSTGLHHKGWSVEFVDDIRQRATQRFAGSDQPDSAECLYVSRADADHRHVRNEAEARATVEALGFKVIEPGHMSFAEQVRTFARARLIVGVHGAGLTNIVWTAPGATLLELVPNKMDDGGYRFLATLAGHRHHHIICRQFEHPSGLAFADIEVDISLLRSTLSELLSRSRM